LALRGQAARTLFAAPLWRGRRSAPASVPDAARIGDERAGGYGTAVASAFLHGTVHAAGDDLQAAVRSDPAALARWQSLTPLGRNEFICWVEDAKRPDTRARRIARTCEELLDGKKRPCCWSGCIHRPDKTSGRWQRAVLIDRTAR
jgi:hypothetical protein